MAKRIAVTSTRGVQAIELAFAGVLAASAYLYVTTGWGTPFPGCWPQLPMPQSLIPAAAQLALAIGFAIAAVRNIAGPTLRDALLLSAILATFSFFAVHGGAYTLGTGIARLGQSGCLEVGPPWSYVLGGFAILVGAIALYAAAELVRGGAASE